MQRGGWLEAPVFMPGRRFGFRLPPNSRLVYTGSTMAETASSSPRGRAASGNPTNRFERLSVESEVPGPDRVPTVLLRDTSRSILAENESPDIPFDVSINPYRGCEHGCIYCYARPFHEFLGFSAGLDFETKILVKEDAPELLKKELAAPKWQPRLVALSGVTDPYQPIERKLEITRRCLEVLAEARNPVSVITKNALITRDVDLLAELARHQAVVVTVSITHLDGSLTRTLEPRTSHPRERLKAVAQLAEAGIPVGVNVAPVIPGLTDHEIPRILEAAAEAGATHAAYLLLRLPGAVSDLFVRWLEEHFPDRKDKVLNRIRSLRDGQLNDSRFGKRFRGEGVFAEQISTLFHTARRRHGLKRRGPELSAEAFRRPGEQMALF